MKKQKQTSTRLRGDVDPVPGGPASNAARDAEVFRAVLTTKISGAPPWLAESTQLVSLGDLNPNGKRVSKA